MFRISGTCGLALTLLCFSASARAQDCNTNGVQDSVELVDGAAQVFWLEAFPGEIWRASVSSGVPQMPVSGLQEPFDIKLHNGTGRMYWTDRTAGTVNRALIDGSQPLTLASGLTAPTGIYWRMAQVYFADAVDGTILRVSQNGGSPVVLVHGLNSPTSLSISPQFIYFSDFGDERIARCDLDGSNMVTLASTPTPEALDVDNVGGFIFWVDNNAQMLRRSTLVGDHITDVTSLGSVCKGISVRPRAGHIYLTYDGGIIERRRLDGSEPVTVFSGLGAIRGLTVQQDVFDCNTNGQPDECDLGSGDCNTNGIPDACEALLQDCNNNGVIDPCEMMGADIAVFESGIVNPANGHSYLLTATTVTWTAGEAYAVSLGGHLATINDAAENEWVRTTFSQVSPASNLWIGFTDEEEEGTFRWAGGEPVTYTNWNSGEPNNNGGNEHYCEFLLSSAGKWNDRNNQSRYALIELEVTGDCNTNFILDACEIASGVGDDCDTDGIPDVCQIALTDCDTDGITDLCEFAAGSVDCNSDSIPDECQLEFDCNTNGVPDGCEVDCDTNQIADVCQLDGCGLGDSSCADCNSNGVLDTCDLGGASFDLFQTAIVNPANGHGYIVTSFSGTWTQCEAYAVSLGGHLASVNDSDEDLWLRQMLADVFPGTRIWIGLTDEVQEGVFRWSSGEPVTYTHWLGGEPNNNNGEEHYVEILLYQAGFWNDRANHQILQAVIELELTNDCNTNGILDACEIADGDRDDCNSNGLLDECEFLLADCNSDGVTDLCDLSMGAPDCNTDSVPDSCELVVDCNTNSVLDICEVDCDTNLIPDECQMADCGMEDASCADCNANGVLDVCDLRGVTLETFNSGFFNPDTDHAYLATPFSGSWAACEAYAVSIGGHLATINDAAENEWVRATFRNVLLQSGAWIGFTDEGQEGVFRWSSGEPVTYVNWPIGEPSNSNGVEHYTDLGLSTGLWNDLAVVGEYGIIELERPVDCNGNELLDECEIAGGLVNDCNTNDVLDECEFTETDCDTDGVTDVCEVAMGQVDCNTDLIPDECQVIDDCNTNGVPDECEPDCDGDAIPDLCEIAMGADDCNTNVVPDLCEPDCDNDGLIDECEFALGFVDCDTNGVPDECELGAATDCNTNGVLDHCDTTLSKTADCNTDGIPDECSLNDCNTNGLLDLCELNDGLAIDCNTNQLIDLCELATLEVVYQSDVLSPFAGGYPPPLLEVAHAPEAAAGVHVSVRRTADIDDHNEYYWLRLNNTLFDTGYGGYQCEEQVDLFEIDAATWNAARAQGAGDIELVAVPLSTIGFEICPGEAQFTVTYSRAGVDCDANGVLDSCEMFVDCNTNDVPDLCDAQETGDCDGDGVPDLCDIYDDLDADLAPDDCDTCPGLTNPDQRNWYATTIHGADAGQYNTLAFDPSGRATLAFRASTNLDLMLWHDDNGDLEASMGEFRTIQSLGDAGSNTSLEFDRFGVACASYHDVTSMTARYWRDTNGDFAGSDDEIHVIGPVTESYHETALTFDHDGHAVVGFYAGPGHMLKIWRDINGNSLTTANELKIFPPLVGALSSISINHDSTGMAHFAARNSGSLIYWRDADRDWAYDAGEVVTIESDGTTGFSPDLLFDEIDRVIIVYYIDSGGDLRLFHDVNGNGASDPGEVRRIFHSLDVGLFSSARFDSSGTLVVSFYDSSRRDLLIWRDANQNLDYEVGEVEAIATQGEVGLYTSLAIDPSTGAPVVVYRDDTNHTFMLIRPLDWDNDGICVINDPCPSVANGGNGDLDHDGDVDGNDLAMFLVAFGGTVGDGAYRCDSDLDGDGMVTLIDYQEWLAAYRTAVGDPFAAAPLPTNAGDLNTDGVVDGDDIAPFVATIISPGTADLRATLLSDLSHDGALDVTDAAAFVARLLNAP